MIYFSEWERSQEEEGQSHSVWRLCSLIGTGPCPILYLFLYLCSLIGTGPCPILYLFLYLCSLIGTGPCPILLPSVEQLFCAGLCLWLTSMRPTRHLPVPVRNVAL